jgi:hypothetical protein
MSANARDLVHARAGFDPKIAGARATIFSQRFSELSLLQSLAIYRDGGLSCRCA